MKQKQKLIIPVTPTDFQKIEEMVSQNNDTICSFCDGKLKTSGKLPFSKGIFYICKQCGKEFKKTNYTNFQTEENYFVLEEI